MIRCKWCGEVITSKNIQPYGNKWCDGYEGASWICLGPQAHDDHEPNEVYEVTKIMEKYGIDTEPS